jgi:hypothetical protein
MRAPAEGALVDYAIPDWVPGAARRRIIELSKYPSTDDEARALLKRLATRVAMKTEVWEKLPLNPQNAPAEIINWAYFAFWMFPSLPRPYPNPKNKRKWDEWARHAHKHPPLPDPAHASTLAQMFSDEMSALRSVTELHWAGLWEGDPSVSADRALATVDHLRKFFGRMAELYQPAAAAFPKVKRRTRAGRQKFFSEYLSQCMMQAYGQPFDAIVAALTEVAFNISRGVAAETIRGRRRIVTAPENSARKSR